MQVAPILQINNKAFSNVFCSKEQTDKDNILSDDKIRYSLISLAVLAMTGIVYKKLKPNTIEPIKTSTLQDLRTSLKGEELQKFEEEYANFDFSQFEIFNQLQISHQTDIFKRLFVLLKNKPKRPVEIPKIITSNASESELKNIGNLFNKEFEFSSYQTDYENTSLQTFIAELERFSEKSDKNYKTLTINNFDKFLSDIKQKGNESYKKRFEDLLEKNQKNKMLYIVKENPENEINEYYKIFLKFNSKK